LAARLVGLLARSTRKLTAVMDVEHVPGKDARKDEEHVVQIAQQAAQTPVPVAEEKAPPESAPATKDVVAREDAPAQTPLPENENAAEPEELPAREPQDDAKPPPIEPAQRAKNVSVPESVAAELAKGYDLALFGFDLMPAENAELTAILEGINSSYEGARAFVVSRERRPDEPLHILLPVTGADYSRRGAEVAVALAAAAEVPLSVLCVSRVAARTPWYLRSREALPEDKATIEAIRRLADHRDVTILPHIEAHARPDIAITRFASRMGASLIVLGVKERLGPAPSFGPTADSVLNDARCSVLLLST
jgi:nucleotide-binding universal stress UspA family protein